MKTKLTSARLAGLLVLLGFTSIASADRPWLESESTYLGDGWFRYRVGTRACPFLNTLTVGYLGVNSTNWVQVGPVPARWAFTNQPSQATWTADDQYSPWQTEPYDAVFELRSSMTNYQRGKGIVTMSLTLFEMPGLSSDLSYNIVGYWRFPALVPCLPAQADGSGSSLYTNKSFGDIAITHLIRDHQGTWGIEFNYSYGDATFLLQASSDMATWQNVTYLYGQSGDNIWTNSTNLGQYGNFFRLEYVGMGQIAPDLLPPLNPTARLAATMASAATKSVAQSKSVQPIVATDDGNLTVRLNTTPGRTYEVDVYDAGKLVWSASSAATQSQLIVPLPVDDLPDAGVIQALELP